MAKKGKSPAFSFYANDWLSSPKIMLMTPEEEGAYIRLLCYAWADPKCSLPDDDDQLAVLSRLGERWFNGCSTHVRECFEVRNGRLVNARLLAERAKQDARSRQNQKAGIKSGTVRRSGANVRSTNVERNSAPSVDVSLNLSSSSSSSSSSEETKQKARESPDATAQPDLMDDAIRVVETWNRFAADPDRRMIPCPGPGCITKGELVECLGNPAWLASLDDALAKFPLAMLDEPVSIGFILKAPDRLARIERGDFNRRIQGPQQTSRRERPTLTKIDLEYPE